MESVALVPTQECREDRSRRFEKFELSTKQADRLRAFQGSSNDRASSDCSSCFPMAMALVSNMSIAVALHLEVDTLRDRDLAELADHNAVRSRATSSCTRTDVRQQQRNDEKQERASKTVALAKG